MEIEREILEIKQRNQKVELDKKWETSWTRRFAIFIFTYAVAEAWLLIINEQNSWAKALVPAAGFMLSTMSLKTVKNWWTTKANN